MPLSTTIERLDLPLDAAFSISRGTQETATVHVVTVTDDAGRTGYGAAAPADYYGETPETVADTLPDLCDLVETEGDPHAQQRLARQFYDRAPDAPAARAAGSVAVHDLAARQADEPLYRRWGLDPDAAPQTSYTVGIAERETMAERAATIVDAGYPILKIKLGTDDDHARLRAVREAAPDATIRVDANEAWAPEQALDNLDWLDDVGVELLEQPVAASDPDGLTRVRDAAPMPIAADESCVTAGDIPAVADAVDVVVVKLMKCGGLGPAIHQICTAHAHGLDAMLGCMIEPNPSIAAACHLAPLVEYADLDGSLLLAEDPFDGVSLAGGDIDLRGVDRAGTGVERR
jgi:L-alanine-DL-glutamate epimerase-like enolase superfamily enzyme